LIGIGRNALAAIFSDGANRLCFFIGGKRNCRQTQSEGGGKKEPLVNEYLSHLGRFIRFDEGREAYVTGMVKNFTADESVSV
jgi:hypothetical protein